MRNIFLIICTFAVFFELNTAQANPFQNEAEEQTYDAYRENPASIDPNLKSFKSSLQAYRMNSENSKISGLGVDEKTVNATSKAPMAGFVDTMFSKEHANQLGLILSSPYVLYSTTMQLTEPAVAAGVHSSAMQGYGALNARYQSEQNFLLGLDKDPETRQIVLRAYQECQANLIRPRSNASKKDVMTWIEAQSKCMGDRTKSIDTKPLGGANFDKLAAGQDITGKGFDFAFDKSWPQGSKMHEIRLSDYIFNESNAAKINLGYSLKDIKDGFRQLMGDYIFTFDEFNSSARSASRELKYKYEAPGKARHEWLEKKAEENYNKLMDELYWMCFETTSAASDELDGDVYCKANRSTLQYYFVGLSFVGYEFDCKLLRSMFESFRYDNPEIAKSSGVRDCSIFKSGGGTSAGGSGGKKYKEYLEIVKAKTEFSKSGHVFVVALADEISVGQMFLIIQNVIQAVDNLTSTNAYFVRTFAMHLIENFIGKGDVQQRYNQVLSNISTIISNINEFNIEHSKDGKK